MSSTGAVAVPVSLITVRAFNSIIRCILVPSIVLGIKYEERKIGRKGTRGRKRKERE